LPATRAEERSAEMKKQKLAIKKMRIDKETLLPLGSRQVDEVAGGASVPCPTFAFHYSTTTYQHG
jgi:hypothetical protein